MSEYSPEVLLFPQFYRKFVLRRINDFNKIHSLSELTELPRQCVLHLLNDNFLMNKPVVFVPEQDNVFLMKRPVLKFMHHVVNPVKGILPIKEEFVLPPKGLIPTLMNYRRRNMRYIKPWESVKKPPLNINSQMVISYHSLYRARIFGMMKGVRRFDYVFSSLINQICSMPNQVHLVPIPVGDTEWKKTQFVMSFKKYDKASIKFPMDNWYLFVMNLVGHMHTKTPSLFSKMPKEIQANTYFLLYSNTDFIVVNLNTLVEFNTGDKDVVIPRFLKQLGELSTGGQANSFTDFGTVEPNIDVEEDINLDGVKLTDINKEEIPVLTAEDPAAVKKTKQPPKVTPEEKLNGIVTDEEVVERPKVKLPDNAALAKRFKSVAQVRDHERLSARYGRMLVETHALDTFEREKISRDKFLAIVSQALASKTEESPKAVEPSSKKENLVIDQPIKKSLTSNLAPTDLEADIIEEEADDGILGELQESEKLPEIVDEINKDYVKIQPHVVLNGKLITNSPAYTKSVGEKERHEFDKQTTYDIDAKALETINQHTELSQAQYNRAVKMSNMYKSIEFNYNDRKVNVYNLLNDSLDDTVSTGSLSFLKGQVPDESMLRSSVCNFDTEYMERFWLRDLVMELASFNKVGMFLKDLKITDISDSMNNMLEINAKYEDINHKSHTIRFTVPKVDNRGYCYINGGLKVLKKQRISVPICKVSPTRVTLTSDYGKYLVERVTTVAHSFINYVDKIVSAAQGQIKVSFGTAKLQPFIYPYEFSAIAKKYTSMAITAEGNSKDVWYFFFNDSSLLVEYFESKGFTKEQIKDAIDEANERKAYLIGMHNPKNPELVFMKVDGSALVSTPDGVSTDNISFVDILCELTGVTINHLSEWSEFKLLSKSVPTIFALAYRYGLSYMLNYTKCKYYIYERKGAYPRKQSDVIIKFKDKILVIPRAPLCFSLLFAGLNNYDLTQYNMEEMDSKDVYYDLLTEKRMSVHNLKGIDNFFDLFVDPITRDILFRMGEPTEAKDLLIRSTALLTTEDCPPVSVCSNHRFRSYERMNTAVYKTLSTLFSQYRYRAMGTANTFSVKDFEITNMIISDQLMENIEQINPVNDIKYREEYGHGGTGGRQSVDTFMIEDRQWPEDGIGIIGESSLDNGKTGYAGNMSDNPNIDNIRGLTISKKIEDLEPSEILTCSSLLGPCVMQDDSKRFSFLNIHLSHYVATQENSLPRMRTGYERVVAHRCKLPFAYAAEYDGVIESIDDDAHVLVVSYPQQEKKVAVEYGEIYTNNGGGGFYCTQHIVVNNFKAGDKVKQGDVIIYNDQFFHADPFNKQVDSMFGKLVNVALIDAATTVEDSNIISEKLSKELMFNPVHPRDIIITKKTNIHKYAAIGTQVSNTDPLMIFDQSEMTEDMFGKIDEETAVLLSNVNRQTPRAKFSGKIVKIDVFYLGSTEGMSNSARNLVNMVNREKSKKYQQAKGTSSVASFYPATDIKQSTRIGTTVLDDETLIVRFFIQQDMTCGSGDKAELDSSLKTVCSTVSPTGWKTEDGSVICDAIFSQRSQAKRLISSPILTGIGNRILEKIEKDILEEYFGK